MATKLQKMPEFKFYIESFYQTLAIFVLFPFVADLLPRLKPVHALLLLAIIFTLRIGMILTARDWFTDRAAWMKSTLAQHPGKFIIHDEDAPMEFLKLPWAVSFESLMLSAAASPDSARSFIILHDVNYYSGDDSTGRFIYTPMRMIDYNRLNRVYFRPAPGPYRVLKKNEVPAGF